MLAFALEGVDAVHEGSCDFGEALAGDAGEEHDFAAAGFFQGGAAGADLSRGHGVGLVEDEELGLFGEAAAVGLELVADGAPGFDGALGGAVDEVEEDGAAFDVAEEAVTEARAFVGAFDEAGDVREDELLGVGEADDAELGVQGGEGVVRDFGAGCAGDDGEERAFAGVGEADEACVRDEFEAEPDPALLAGPAGGPRFAGGAVGAGS